jgi:hypothetical protein
MLYRSSRRGGSSNTKSTIDRAVHVEGSRRRASSSRNVVSLLRPPTRRAAGLGRRQRLFLAALRRSPCRHTVRNTTTDEGHKEVVDYIPGRGGSPKACFLTSEPRTWPGRPGSRSGFPGPAPPCAGLSPGYGQFAQASRPNLGCRISPADDVRFFEAGRISSVGAAAFSTQPHVSATRRTVAPRRAMLRRLHRLIKPAGQAVDTPTLSPVEHLRSGGTIHQCIINAKAKREKQSICADS